MMLTHTQSGTIVVSAGLIKPSSRCWDLSK
jgi:hypothetical protein